MNKKTLEKLADLKDTQKALAVAVKDQEQVVMKAMKDEGLSKIEIEVGAFTIVKYPSYKYSAPLRKAEAALKTAQALERVSGKAKVVGETEGVRYMPSQH